MSLVPQQSDRPEAPLFADGLGERVVAADGATGELLQILRLRPALTAVPSFEFALRERAARLANFRHAYYARVRRIDRVQQAAGSRLSRITSKAHACRTSSASPTRKGFSSTSTRPFASSASWCRPWRCCTRTRATRRTG